MEGRFHQYEGYPLKKITLPVRVMKRLGAKLLIVSQAVGGMNPYYRTGDVMIIDDHINLMGDNPLVGVNDDRLGPRFPDMSRPYDAELIEKGLEIARQENFVAHRGVTVAVKGPNLNTAFYARSGPTSSECRPCRKQLWPFTAACARSACRS
jgi:purine-nucleoside phosphorylase